MHDDRHVLRDRVGKRLANEQGCASGFRLLDIRAANGQNALYVGGFRDEEQPNHCPRPDDPAAPADELPRG